MAKAKTLDDATFRKLNGLTRTIKTSNGITLELRVRYKAMLSSRRPDARVIGVHDDWLVGRIHLMDRKGEMVVDLTQWDEELQNKIDTLEALGLPVTEVQDILAQWSSMGEEVAA